MYRFNYKIAIGLQRKKSKCQLIFNVNQNKLLIYKLQSIYSKQNQRQITHGSNKSRRKPSRSVKKAKLTISLCKKFSSRINYLQLLI